jgi:hypothetical protein
MKELTEAEKHITEETRVLMVSLDEKLDTSDVFTSLTIFSRIATSEHSL